MTQNNHELLHSLCQLKVLVEQLFLKMKMRQLHYQSNIKIYNPHCPSFKTCKKSVTHDCFFCDNNMKGTEAYCLEKLIYQLVDDEDFQKMVIKDGR